MAKQRWRHIEGPDTVFAIARAGQLGWMFGSNEGIWKYVDGICSILSESLRPAAITTVAVAPDFPMDPVAVAGAADGIATSVDEGSTWVGATMPKLSQISLLAMSPHFRLDGVAFAATMQDGVLLTADHGATWQTSNFGLLDLETVGVAVSPNFADDGTVVVFSVHGVFCSHNGGRAWRELAFPIDAVPLSGMTFAGSLLVAGSEGQGLLYSPDGGTSWGKRSSFRSGPVSAVAASNDGRILAVATPQVVASTEDQGINWMRTEGHVPEGIICLAVDDSGSLIAGTQDTGPWIYGG